MQIQQISEVKVKNTLRELSLPLSTPSKSKMNGHSSLLEKVLIRKIRSGDSSIFSILFTSYYRDLVLYAGRMTGNKVSAEDIVQEFFADMWKNRENLDIKTSLRAFMLTSVKNRCIDSFRHEKIAKKYADSKQKAESRFESSTENYILFSELQEHVDKALKNLPRDIYQPFMMNRLKGLKYHEIAEILDVSIRTVEVRIGKALHLLRMDLKDYFLSIILILFIFSGLLHLLA